MENELRHNNQMSEEKENTVFKISFLCLMSFDPLVFGNVFDLHKYTEFLFMWMFVHMEIKGINSE